MLKKRNFRSLVMRRYPFFNSQYWSKQKSLTSFLNKYCALSPGYCTDDIDKAQKFIVDQNYDAIVVGSDTVWEVRENGGAPLAPNIYTFPNKGGTKKLAFAVSADQTKKALLKQNGRDGQLLSNINSFDYISVRDENTRQILLDIGLSDTEIVYMPDPTILWDFSPLVEEPPDLDTGKKGLAGVGIADPFLKKRFTQLLNAEGFLVINLLGQKVNGQLGLPSNYSLNQRLGIYKYLDFMVTDRFHASIFGLKLGNAPVLFVERGAVYQESISKGRDLFKRLDIEDMVWRCEGRQVPRNLLEQYHVQWEKLNLDNKSIKSNLDILRNKSDKQLEKFMRCFIGLSFR